jgi:BolA protein
MTDTATRIEKMRTAFEQTLEPLSVEIEDQSHLHRGHAGARSGKGHFHVKIVAQCFAGLSMIERHRRVYTALGPLMESDIHAVGIEALAPSEQA